MGKDLKGKELGEGIYQQKDGTYSARYTDFVGKRITKRFKNVKEAKQWIINCKSNNNLDVSVNNGMKLSDWYQIYFSTYLDGKRKEGTLQIKDYYWRKIETQFGDRRIQAIENKDVQKYFNQLHEEIAENTVRQMYSFFNDLMRKAKANKIINHNPCEGIDIRFVKTLEEENPDSEDKIRVVEDEEFDLIISSTVSDTYKAIYTVAIGTGMRVSELVGLRWENIDFENSIIHVREQLIWRQRIKVWERTTPKTKTAMRDIPMNKDVKEALLEMNEIKDSIPASNNDLFNELVFKTKVGKIVDPRDLNKRLSFITNALNMHHVSMHDFRHTFATRCVEKGVKPKSLQKLMGHSSLITTLNIYYHASLENDEELQKLLG